MPYIPAGRRQTSLFLAMLVFAFLVPAATAGAATVPGLLARVLSSTSFVANTCMDPLLSQPFQSLGDQGYYTLAPGESDDNFTGDGWILLNGANITSATLADGSTGDVLDLPAWSVAISPPMCVASNYATARTMARTVTGENGVELFVSYAGSSTWSMPQDGGSVQTPGTGWALSDPLNLNPSQAPGWQVARFALVSNPGRNENQLYDFYVDPYAKG